jgi:hypothetical protein
LSKVSASVKLDERWSGFGSWGSISSSWLSSLGWCWWGGILFGLLFSLGGISHDLLNWSWGLDVEVWVFNNMVWHVSNPCLSWGVEWKSLLGIVSGFPGGMSISNFSSRGGLEVGIVFFDVEDVSLMGLEGSSLSLLFSSSVDFLSGSKDLNHIVGSFLGGSGGI